MTNSGSELNRRFEFPEPPALIRPPRMSIPEGLSSGQRSEAPATKFMHEIVPESHPEHGFSKDPHWVIVCSSVGVMNEMKMKTASGMLRMHRDGVWLHGVEDPYEGEQCSWNEVQEQSLALGARAISLFQLEGQPFVIWSVFSSPGMPSLRFLMNGVEFTYEYSQGYPAEALFENVEFPLEN